MAEVEQKKRHYSKVGLEVRKKIINRVFQQGYSIASTAKYLKIKLSSAKVIIQKYRKTGEIHVGRKDRLNNQRLVKNKQQEQGVPEQNRQEPAQKAPSLIPQLQNPQISNDTNWYYPYPQWPMMMSYPQQYYNPYWCSYYSQR